MRGFSYIRIVYAIVDIETTGGFATGNGITEIAIVLHDGKEIEGCYHTLVNPFMVIPRYIVALTGITNEMVAEAPSFTEIGETIYGLLKDRVFVAHNVNFDYSFVKHHLNNCGFILNTRKLCTVRLARKIFPGLASYSLGNLCRSLEVTITDRHRAKGDALATAEVFNKIIRGDNNSVVAAMLKGRNAEQFLPPHMPGEEIDKLPEKPGVYYFENQKKEIIYVGKAINLRKRVRSHFSNNDGSKRKQELLRNVYHLSYKECSSELMALILESQEIRQRWPLYNRSQKKYHHKYGLYSYEDSSGLLQLVIEQKKSNLPAIYTFNAIIEGQAYIRKIKSGKIATGKVTNDIEIEEDKPDFISTVPESAESYNKRILDSIEQISLSLPSFVLIENRPSENEGHAVYLMEKGRFYGMTILPDPFKMPLTLECWKQNIPPSADNDYIRGLLFQHAEKNFYTRLNLHE